MRQLGLSLLFHAALVLLLLLGSRPRPSSAPRELITIDTIPVAASPGAKTQGQKHVVRHSKPAPLVSLDSIGLKYHYRPKTAPEPDAKHPPSPSNLATGGGGGAAIFFNEAQNFGVFRYLYKRIGENLGYPSELRQAGIEGHVSATLSFSKSAEYLKDQSSITGTSPYLRVVVAQALRRAMSGPLPETMRRPAGPFVIHCSFDFEFTEHDDAALVAAGNLQLGSEFQYFRNWRRSKLQWDLGPFHGLAPLPFIGFSPGEFAEEVAGLFSKKSKPDPLQKYRDDPEF